MPSARGVLMPSFCAQAAIKDVSEQLKQSTQQLTHTLKVRTRRPLRLPLTVPPESDDQGVACSCSIDRMPP